jgi:HlyD family secretion protein
MQVEADIDESDIGMVKEGQRVEFDVDAYPSEKFAGTVEQIRLSPVTTSNVVTYTVIINAPNPDQKLLPGMTANIVIYAEELENVLTVRYKAMKFKPEAEYLAGMKGGPAAGQAPAAMNPPAGAPLARVWSAVQLPQRTLKLRRFDTRFSTRVRSRIRRAELFRQLLQVTEKQKQLQ